MSSASRREGRPTWRSLPLVIVLGVAPIAGEGQEVRWTGTTSFSTGSYVFDAPTRTLALATGLGLSWGRLDLTDSLPLVLQNSQLVSQVGGVPLPTGGESHGVVGGRTSGQTLGTGSRGAGGGAGGSTAEVLYRNEYTWSVGDPFLSASARLLESTGTLRALHAQVSAKAPLRDLDSGVGTGEWDWGAGGSATVAFGETYAFTDVMYWSYGDLAELELSDGVSYALGLSRAVLHGRGSVILSFLGSAPIIDTMDRPASVGVGALYSPRPGRSVSGGVAVGLSESSPDVSVYVGWSMRLG